MLHLDNQWENLMKLWDTELMLSDNYFLFPVLESGRIIFLK